MSPVEGFRVDVSILVLFRVDGVRSLTVIPDHLKTLTNNLRPSLGLMIYINLCATVCRSSPLTFHHPLPSGHGNRNEISLYNQTSLSYTPYPFMTASRQEETIETIRKLFDIIPETPCPDDDLLSFLDTRSELEKDPDLPTLEGYTSHYETFRTYALDEKLMKELQFLIKWHLQFQPDSFFSSEFYRKFKHHSIILKAIDDHRNNFNLI